MNSRIYQEKDGEKVLDLISLREHLSDFKNLTLNAFNPNDSKDYQFIKVVLELIDITRYTINISTRYPTSEFKLKNFSLRVNHKMFRLLLDYLMHVNYHNVSVKHLVNLSSYYFMYQNVKITLDESLEDFEYSLTETLMTNKIQ